MNAGHAAIGPEPLLSVRDLTVSFVHAGGSVRAVDGVSLTLHPDQTLAVVGESGSGKSVTALSVLRLVPSPPSRVDQGRVVFRPEGAGREVDVLSLTPQELRAVRGRQIAMIFQEPMTSLNPLMTVGEQVAEVVRAQFPGSSREARDRAVRALADVGIPDAARRARAYPHEFSGGMRQRVMIAAALACEPRVLLADEPTTALDVTTQAQILDLIERVRAERAMGVLFITHDLGIVARRADTVCVMYAGRVVEYGATADVLSAPAHPYTRGLLACRPTPGARRSRLTTVREAIDRDQGASDAWKGAGLRAWWPGGARPPDVMPGGPESVLVEAVAGRWVRLWGTPAALSLPRREPDVPARRSMQRAAAAAG